MSDKQSKPLVVYMRPGCSKTRFGARRFEGIVIRDGSELYDPELIHEILRAPGSINITNDTAQEAVDLGFIKADVASSLGYQIQIGVDADGEPIYAEAPKESKVVHVNRVPDFVRYGAQELEAYAEDNNIVFNRAWDHQDKAEACRQHALREQAKLKAAEKPKIEHPPEPEKPEPIAAPKKSKKRGSKRGR